MANYPGYDFINKAPLNVKLCSMPVADNGDAQRLYVPPAVGTPVGSVRASTILQRASVQNRSGSTSVIGVAARIPVANWTAGQITSAGAYTADTTDAQDAGADDFPLFDRADDGSGIIVSADVPFNAVAIQVSTAGNQVGPTMILEYWDGTAWTAITTNNYVFLNWNSTGERECIFAVPATWVTGGSGTSVPSGKYNARLRMTHGGAGTINPSASQLFVARAYGLQENVTDNTVWAMTAGNESGVELEPLSDGVFLYTSTAALNMNVELTVRAAFKN